MPGEDVGTITDAGAVNVIYYSPGANQLSFPNNQFWTQDSPASKRSPNLEIRSASRSPAVISTETR